MAILSNVFKPEDVEEDKPMNAGIYLMEVTKTKYTPTKAKNGMRMILSCKVIDGEYEGTVITEGLNLENPNPMAVKIARRQLKQLMEAVGLEELEDTDELIGLPFAAKVKIEPAQNGYDAKNGITAFMDPDEYDPEADED